MLSRQMASWSTDTRSGDWLVERIHGFAQNVGSIVPNGFESYARVFHPIPEGPWRRWRDVAAHNGRLVHPEMQFHLISRPPGETPDGYEPLSEMAVGSLPSEDLRVLADVLARLTAEATPCWFAVWEGFGHLHGSPSVVRISSSLGGKGPEVAEVAPIAPRRVLEGARLELPNRAYVLLHGVLQEAPDLFELLGDQSPNLWWPEDHSWCVATEIDLGWTYVAGSEALVEHVVRCPDLEVLRARITDGVTYDSDLLNAALDDS